MSTYKAVMRPALEYASSMWSPLASSTSINKLQVMHNAAWELPQGCTQDTNIKHMHGETLILPIHEYLRLHASQCRQRTQHPSHPLHRHTTYFNTSRLKHYLLQRPLHGGHSHRPPRNHCSRHEGKHAPYTYVCCLWESGHGRQWKDIAHTSTTRCQLWRDFPRLARRALAQLGTDKSPFLGSCLHKVDLRSHPAPLCPLCDTHARGAHHLFNCTHVHTTLSPLDLWAGPAGVTALLAGWTGNIGLPPPTSKGHGSGWTTTTTRQLSRICFESRRYLMTITN